MSLVIDRRALYDPTRREQPQVLVYGIAHAGAGAAPWKAVSADIPPEIALYGIRLPGRENRVGIAAHTDMGAAAQEVATVINNHVGARGLPKILVGSCFGSLVAAAAAGFAHIDGLISLRQPVPQGTEPDGVDPCTLDNPGLRQWVHDYRLTASPLLEEDNFEVFGDVLQKDLSLIRGYRVPDASMTCPIQLVDCSFDSGQADWEQWSRVTSGAVKSTWLPVDGDPLTDHPTNLAQAVETAVHWLLETQ